MILYLHGFGSSGNAFKARLLRHFFPDVEIVSPDLPAAPQESVSHVSSILDKIAGIQPVLLVGSSLGGFFAQHLSCEKKIPAILLNPAAHPWENLEARVGINEKLNGSGQFEWYETYLEQLHDLYRKPALFQKYLLHAYLNRDDEVLDYTVAQREFESIQCEIIISDEGGHVFTNFTKIRSDIKRIYDALQ